MQAATKLRQVFEEAQSEFLGSSAMRRVISGDLTLPEYKSFLRELYFYTREDPQLQAFATAYFKGEDRALVRTFLKHAISEVGHDQLALNDLAELGGNVANVSREFPLPTTVALTSFPYWATQFLNPISYLGYLYFLEALPTSSGKALMQSLRSAGIPDTAMTFIQDHTTIDMAHIKLMEIYVDKLIRTERDLADVSYALVTTAKLYQNMIEGAIQAAGSQAPRLPSLGEVERLNDAQTIAAE